MLIVATVKLMIVETDLAETDLQVIEETEIEETEIDSGTGSLGDQGQGPMTGIDVTDEDAGVHTLHPHHPTVALVLDLPVPAGGGQAEIEMEEDLGRKLQIHPNKGLYFKVYD